jgi:branched-chain amino acid transport system ATP-binding protein
MLEVRDIHTYYDQSHVLQGATLDVRENEVVALLGRNGMGKTTLVRSIIGFNPPRRGSIRYRGQEIAGLEPHQISRLGVAIVPQGRRAFPSLSVAEHLSAFARPGSGKGWTVERLLETFPRLRERFRNSGNKLSGGEQQMLVIGRALSINADLLIMDEPSEGLSPMMIRELARIIESLRKSGMSILLVEQNLSFALSVADRVYIISKGVIECNVLPDQLRQDHELRARYLGV